MFLEAHSNALTMRPIPFLSTLIAYLFYIKNAQKDPELSTLFTVLSQKGNKFSWQVQLLFISGGMNCNSCNKPSVPALLFFVYLPLHILSSLEIINELLAKSKIISGVQLWRLQVYCDQLWRKLIGCFWSVVIITSPNRECPFCSSQDSWKLLFLIHFLVLLPEIKKYIYHLFFSL